MSLDFGWEEVNFSGLDTVVVGSTDGPNCGVHKSYKIFDVAKCPSLVNSKWSACFGGDTKNIIFIFIMVIVCVMLWILIGQWWLKQSIFIFSYRCHHVLCHVSFFMMFYACSIYVAIAIYFVSRFGAKKTRLEHWSLQKVI